MYLLSNSIRPNDLQSAIIPNPLVVAADATVMEAIALMSSGRSQCDAENHSDNHQQQFQQETRSSCVLVLEGEKLIGVMTERDVVRLSAQQQDLNRLLVREVMANPVVTLHESDLTDLFLAVNLLQQYHIRHLPLLDDQDLLVGMVTHESLRQITRPIDLMRLRLVSEVMTSDVVCAVSDRSMLAIAQMMAEQKISSVMIVETSSTDTSLQIPVGIVTERDVVQFQALGLNLETCMAHTVMSTPIFSVKPEDNLLTVQQIMEQRLIRRLAVTGEFGELLGIVTQTSLLQALNPTEIYNLAKVLEAKVEQLESEKVTLLENRNIELERLVKERTASLSEAEKTLQKINQALELTVQERTQELWQVNKLQRAILDSNDYAIITTDYLSGIIQTFNAGAEKMLGYSMEEVVGKVTPEIFFDPQECIDRNSSISKEAGQNDWGFGTVMEIATQDILGQEWTNIRKDGSRFPVELSVRSLKDDEGQPIGFLSIRKDISDRKQAQEALKISEERFRNAFDTKAVGMCLVSPLGEFLKVNPALCNFLGYSETELLEMRFQEITHPDDLSTDLDLLSQLLAGEITHYNLEKRYFTKEQRFIWGYLSVSIVRNSQGELLYFVSQIQDISDRKVMEKNLEESRDKFQRLVDNMGEKFVVFSHSGVEKILSYVSDGACPIFGLIKEDILGQPWSDVVNWLPEEIPNAKKRLLSMLQGEQDFCQSEMRFIHPDGSLRTIQVSEHPVRNETGKLLAIEGIVEDISDRKEAEQQLQNITDRLTLALKSGAIGCWEWDIQRNLLVWDDRMYELYGELKATNFHIPYEIWSNAIHPDDRHATETLLQQAVLGQAEYDCEFRVIHPDRSVHFIKAYGKVTRDAQGNAESMIGVNFDISDRKQSETKLHLANEELMRATRLKDEFLANMSHELRTPLNSILGMNEALQDEVFGSINERQLKALKTIESSSTHLLALINDILDVAKIESGQVTLELTATDIDSLCKSSLAFIKQQALTKRIQLIHKIPKYLPEIMIDERRIRQVLINLLNNAVKFTLEGGTITLEVSQVQLESSPTNPTPLNYIKIAVTDTGIGISAENIQKLFQPFIQIDSALNRKHDGTGLGLALVKRLVEIHGGNVELTSEVGVGSCFAINLPINIGDPAIEEQIEKQTGQELSGQPQIGESQTEGLISPLILLAEDNAANIATFSSYLEAKGYRILSAVNGQEAIDLAKAHHPDLILMDIQMPVMDGLEAIKQIRLDPDLVDIPIIALTALAMEGDREKCLAVGANEYLSKPIKLKKLADMITNICQGMLYLT
jgi:PAS domain S-box-containing protein